jgi:lipopolysaccharide export system permease protein
MTSVLQRYVIRSVLGQTLLVMLVLLTLSFVYLFINEQDDIGTGTYSMGDALFKVVLTLPQYIFDLLPIAALIGALLSLGSLARSMELIVIRASGVSTWRVSAWVATAGLILMVVTWIIGEYVAPPLEQYGHQMKTFERFRDFSLAGDGGAWAKDNDTIIEVQQQRAGNSYAGVYVFKFDAQRRLSSVGRASSASIDTDNHWRLSDYRESRIESDRVVASRSVTAQLPTRLSPEFLGLAVIEPKSLPSRGLRNYIQHLKQNGLDARTYETAFWARIARTVAVAIIVVLAVPLSFGPMRGGAGARTVIGVLVGVAFFLLARMLESGGVVYDMSPLAVAWLPTVLLLLVAGVAVARAK